MLIAALAALAVVAAGIGGYNTLRNTGNPAAVTLEATAPVPGASAVLPVGTWQLQGPNSFVGYRVSEPPDVTVVGRTSTLAGTLTLSAEGERVRLDAAEVRADLRELRSDARGRDQALRERILETDRFPEATFTLQEPVEVGTLTAGQPFATRAAGTLTVRERSTPVVADLQARWDGARLRIVGSVDISLGAYAVEVSQVAGVDTIRDGAVIELDLQATPPV